MKLNFSSISCLALLGISITACQTPNVSIKVSPKESNAAPSSKGTQGQAESPNKSTPPQNRIAKKTPSRSSSSASSSLKVLEQPRLALLTSTDPDSQINIRSAPSTSSQALHYGLSGDRIKLLKISEGNQKAWYFIKFEVSKATGWVREDFITQQENSSYETPNYVGDLPQPGELYRKNPKEQIPVYSNSSFNSAVKHYGLSQDQVMILNIIHTEEGHWHYVRFNESGAEGWVHDSDFLPA